MTAPRHLLAAALLILLALAAFLGFRDNSNESGILASTPVTPNVKPAETLPAPIAEIPENEVRSALADVCSTDTLESANKELTEEEIQEQIEAFKELKQSLSERLSVSSSAEHLHLAALLEDDRSLRVDLIERAISRNPSDPYLVWSAIRICSDSGASLDCPLGDWEQRLIAVDGQNSESWIRIAANRYAAGETDTALEAMRNAATAPETRIYWTETVEMIERGLAAAGIDQPFPERAGMAFGFAAMMLPVYGDYTRMCVEQSSQSVEWAYTCLGYGELAENQSKTDIGVSIGRSMQELALEALGDMEKAADIEQRLQRRRQERLSADIERTTLIERLMVSNPTMFSSYLAATRSVGEVTARRQIAAEIERLLEQQPELACQ